MKDIHYIAVLLFLLSLIILFYGCSPKTSRKLLYENRVYPWKVYYVAENNFPAGKAQYYEVYYKDKKLVLPKEITGGLREVDRFKAAGGYDPDETHYNSVLIIFESFVKNERGFEERGTVSIQVWPGKSGSNELEVMNLCTGKTATLAFE